MYYIEARIHTHLSFKKSIVNVCFVWVQVYWTTGQVSSQSASLGSCFSSSTVSSGTPTQAVRLPGQTLLPMKQFWQSWSYVSSLRTIMLGKNKVKLLTWIPLVCYYYSKCKKKKKPQYDKYALKSKHQAKQLLSINLFSLLTQTLELGQRKFLMVVKQGIHKYQKQTKQKRPHIPMYLIFYNCK